jgi:hypothetical protein
MNEEDNVKVNNINVQHAIIINRKMGCNDESSSDTEQAEKILYYYPEETSIDCQLTKINMLEGLIDFSSRFSTQSIDYVLMDKTMWGFLEIEPSIWFFLAIDNKYLENQLNVFNNYRSNGYAILAAMRNMYKAFSFLFGSITVILEGTNGFGWDIILTIQKIRKEIRKIKLRQKQEKQDLETLNFQEKSLVALVLEKDTETELSMHTQTFLSQDNIEYIGIRKDLKSIEQIKEELKHSENEIIKKEKELKSLLCNKNYTPNQVKSILARFMHFYLNSGDIGCPSFFDDMNNGVNFSHIFEDEKNMSHNSSFLRVLQAIEKASRGECIGKFLFVFIFLNLYTYSIIIYNLFLCFFF